MSFQENIFDVSKLRLVGDFEAQVGQLLPLVRLTRTQVENLQQLMIDVENSLSRCWQGCRVYAFGSIVIGLGIANSDIDCYVELPPRVKLHSKLVYKAKSYLEAQPHLFSNLSAIPFAKVPIVKCYHKPTQRNCDINFTSQAGLENSQLLAHMLHLDPRALPLAILIKYWSKVHKLTGTMLMPNYALTLLVIFYLQYVKILPSVYLLQQTAEPRFVENWNTAFDNRALDFSNDGNILTLYQLLGGFFDYYSSFDFQNKIISPYAGAVIEKQCFEQFETIPEVFALYKHNLSNEICQYFRLDMRMCIQDPYNHSRNCAVAVHPKLFDIVLKYIRKSAQLFYEVENGKYLRAILTIEQTKQDGIEIKNSQNRVNRPPPHKIEKKKIQKNAKMKNMFIMYNQLQKRKGHS